MLHSLLISLLSSFLFSPLAHAAPTNVTIDDTNGDAVTGAQITYNPAPVWQAGQSCQNCTAKVDGSQAYDGTWHDASYNPPGGLSNSYPGTIISASADFTGTAVYIYCILTSSSSSPNGNTDMTFYVDDQEVGSFSRPSDGDRSYQYNQVVFSWSGLDGSTNHNVRLESGHSGQQALVLLDRIVYTTGDSSTTTLVIQTSSSSQQSSSSSSGSTTQESSTSQSSSPSSSGSSSSSQTPISSGNSVLTSTPSVSSSSDTSQAFLPSLSVSDSSSSPSGSPSSDSGSSDSSSSNTGTIVGATVGGVGGLCLIAGIWWMCSRRHRSRDEDEAAQAIQPFFSRNTFGGAPGGPGGGSGVRGDQFVGTGLNLNGDQLVGGGLGLNGQASAFHGPTYVTLPVIGNADGAARAGTGTKGSTTLMETSTSSPITPTTLDTPHTPVSPPPHGTMYTTVKTWANTGAGNDPDQHPYAINVRSEKMRQLQAQQLQNQSRGQARGGVQGHSRRLPNRTLPSPFSPIPLYAPTQEQSDVVSPSSASATLSAVESNSQIHSQGHTENMRENTELIRRWNSTGRPNGTGAGVGEASGTDGWDDDSNATPEPVSPYSLLRPNRRREPAPLDDRAITPKNPPPRPQRSHVRRLTRILEISHTGNEADNDVSERPRGRVGSGGGQGRRGGINIDADVVSDDGSDVRWQRKLANLFTPSSAAATAGDGSAQDVEIGKERQTGWEGTRPTPPPDPVVYIPSSRPQMRAGPTPPPPYQPGLGV
ncbi:hypothetical protein ACEPAH_7040 [Sanghuangporus vaninii]